MMGVSKKEAFRFLESLFNNRLAEADRFLHQLEEKYPNDRRYIFALRGIYNSYTGEDKDSLIYMLYLNSGFRKGKREIKQHFERLSKLFGEDDRYFTAWKDVLDLLEKLPKPVKISSEQQG